MERYLQTAHTIAQIRWLQLLERRMRSSPKANLGASAQDTLMIEYDTEGFVEVTGGKIWYGIKGKNYKGIPIITLHGGPGAPHNYLESLETLSDDRPIIFYDQLGCGKSERPLDNTLWTVSRFVEELNSLRDFLNIRDVHLMGQSWGSILACEYYLFRPYGIRSLILSGPAMSIPRFERDVRNLLLYLPKEYQNAIANAEATGDYDSVDYEKAVTAFYRRHICRLDKWPACLDDTISGMGKSVYNYMYGPSEFTVTGTLKEYDCTSKLSQIEVPVLLTCGQYDEVTPETAAHYAREMQNSKLVVIYGASHEHHLEKPEEYIQTVRGFVESIEKHAQTARFE